MPMKLEVSEEVKNHLIRLREALADVPLNDTDDLPKPQYGCGGTCKALCCHEFSQAFLR